MSRLKVAVLSANHSFLLASNVVVPNVPFQFSRTAQFAHQVIFSTSGYCCGRTRQRAKLPGDSIIDKNRGPDAP